MSSISLWFSDSAFAFILRQFELSTNEYLIKNENQLFTEGLLKESVSSLP